MNVTKISMNVTKIVVATLLSVVVLSACSVQQRYHRKGFNVNWNNTSIKVKNDKNKVTSSEEIESQEIVAKNVRVTNHVTESALISASTKNEFDGIIELPTQTLATVKANESVQINVGQLNKKETEQNIQSNQNLSKKEVKQIIKKGKNENSYNKSSEVPTVLLFILCFIIPPVAVGLATDWDLTPVIWNVVWTLLCGFPGVIHAIIHVLRNR
jgi:uncharacterized membrane protein YqaE (UPF0057 family)